MTTANLIQGIPALAEWAERAQSRAREAGEPQWSLDARRAAAGVATALPFPSREDGLWRRTDFRTESFCVVGEHPLAGGSPLRLFI